MSKKAKTKRPPKRDDALRSLAILGNTLAALLPDEEPVSVQESLFPMPEKRGY